MRRLLKNHASGLAFTGNSVIIEKVLDLFRRKDSK